MTVGKFIDLINHKLSVLNKSGYTGVRWRADRNKWTSVICVNGKNISLGHHTHVEDAIAARKEAEVKYFGDFARKEVG